LIYNYTVLFLAEKYCVFDKNIVELVLGWFEKVWSQKSQKKADLFLNSKLHCFES